MSRSTFYRHFYDKYELLNAYYDTVLNRTLYRCRTDLTWKQAVCSIYREIRNNLVFYQNALKSHEMNCLRDHILKISIELHYSILQKNNVDMDDWKNRKLMQSYIFGNFDVMCLWISEGMKEPVADMSELMISRLPEPFTPYFK